MAKRLYAFDDTQIAIGALAERFQRFLIAGAVMRRDRLLNAVELNDDDALQESRLVGFRRVPSRKKPPASCLNRRTGKLGVAGQRVRIRDRAVGCYPISLGHLPSPLCALRRA